MSITRRQEFVRSLAVLTILAGVLVPVESVSGAKPDRVDTALIVAVDISNSVSDQNYKLQMEGIAQALQSDDVVNAMRGGPRGAIAFTLLTWSSASSAALPWTRISSMEEARAVARTIRNVPRDWLGGEFTCLAKLLQFVKIETIPVLPFSADRVVIDVSGDGRDNCDEPGTVAAARHGLVGAGVTINGLPILTEDHLGPGMYISGKPIYAGEAESSEPSMSLDEWYRANVIGGPDSFILPADGFADFARAIRAKFVAEVSWMRPSRTYGMPSAPMLEPAGVIKVGYEGDWMRRTGGACLETEPGAAVSACSRRH